MKKQLLMIATIAMLHVMSLSAQKIMVYLHPQKVYTDGTHWEQPMLDLLDSNDYEVTRFYNNNLPSASADLLDSLNNVADLIIIGRSGSSAEFQSPHKEVWNSIQTPVICLMPWALRSSRMNWFNATECIHYDDSTVNLTANILEPKDTAFSGLDVSSGTMVWAHGPYDVIVATDGGNGTVLAASAVDQSVQMVRFEPFQEFYTGSRDVPADYRTYIGSGYDEAVNINPFNFVRGASMQVFLNEVAFLSGRTTGGDPGGDPGVGVKQLTSNEKFRLYPNPATSTLFIENYSQIEKLTILDLQGKVVGTYINAQNGIDISALPSGLYLLSIEENGDVVNLKFHKK
jgi:hypothetical protein